MRSNCRGNVGVALGACAADIGVAESASGGEIRSRVRSELSSAHWNEAIFTPAWRSAAVDWSAVALPAVVALGVDELAAAGPCGAPPDESVFGFEHPASITTSPRLIHRKD